MEKLTINQHFVPQFLLKHFSSGTDQVVQVLDSTRQKHRDTSIRRVLSQNYFYDNDNTVENFLAEKIEGPAASIIDSIVEAPMRPIEAGNPALLTFIAVQMARTPGTKVQALSAIDGFSGVLFRQHAEIKGYPIEEVENLKWRPSDDRSLHNRILLRSTTHRWLLEDLSWHVLSNNTELPFVISDHPVVQYNWYLRASDAPSQTAMTKRGVQIFLPLSPSVTLALIDKDIYKFGEKRSIHSVLNDRKDIELLNSLQFRSRQDFVVFPVGMDPKYIDRKCQEIPANSLFRANTVQTKSTDLGDEKRSFEVCVSREQTQYQHWLSLSKIKRRVSKKTVQCVDRRTEMKDQIAAADLLFHEPPHNKS